VRDMGARVVCGRTVCEAIGLDGVMVAVCWGRGARTPRDPHINVRRFVEMDAGLTVTKFDPRSKLVVEFVS
jgi:hypothetical protein